MVRIAGLGLGLAPKHQVAEKDLDTMEVPVSSVSPMSSFHQRPDNLQHSSKFKFSKNDEKERKMRNLSLKGESFL